MTEGRRHRGEGPERGRTYRPRRTATLGGTLVGVLLVAAACSSGPPSPGVASLGSTTTAPAAGSAALTPFADPQIEDQYDLSYAECMRSHGVSGFPDPMLSGNGLSFNPGADSNSPQFGSANGACKHLLPDEGGPPTPAQRATETAALLKYSKCMRTHGEPNFPDPTVSQHRMGFSLNGIDANSPQFQAAQMRCQSLSPGGP